VGKPKKELRVILTGAGCPGWTDIAKCLLGNGERRINLYAVDMAEDTAGYHFGCPFQKVPPGNSEDFVREMLALSKRWEADAIVPLTDPELLPLSKARQAFLAQGTAIPVADSGALAVATDKIKLQKRIAKTGLETGAFGTAETVGQFQEKVLSLGYPEKKLCFKPGIGHGARGFRVLDPQAKEGRHLFSHKPEETQIALTLEQAVDQLSAVAQLPSLLITPYYPGEELSVDLLIHEKRILSAVVRRRDRIRFGLTYHGTVVDDQKVKALAEKIALEVGLTFNANVQFRRDETGTPHLLEINPRTSGTIALCRAAGVNLPYLGLKLALGEKVNPADPAIGVRNFRVWTHQFVDAQGQPIKNV